jgi:hypothetical protein
MLYRDAKYCFTETQSIALQRRKVLRLYGGVLIFVKKLQK